MLLLDNSAWGRLLQGRAPKARADAIATMFDADEIGVCMPFLLEAGFSARSAKDRKAVMARLDDLPRIAIDHRIERLTLHAQRELTETGHHRLAPIDIMIAACAHVAEAGVLHYDRDYDILAEHTSLTVESEWLAPPGTL